MNVPLLDLKAQYATIQHDVEEAILRITRSQACILGAEVDKLEATLAQYCDCRYAIGVSSGTDALLMALMALNIGAGDEVIVPTYSFFATAGAVVRVGATPIFVDSEPRTFAMDMAKVRAAITSKTRAIMPVHLFGQSADMDELMAISSEFGIPIIEDAAQAIGTQYRDGRKVGSIGLMGCFSFYPTKNLGAFGDGGLVTTNDEELAIKLKQVRNHGMEPRYYHKFVGGNFRIDALQAAVLNVKFPLLESWHEARRRNADLYARYFTEAGLCADRNVFRTTTSFDSEKTILLPEAVYAGNSAPKNHHIYNQFSVLVPRRDELRAFLTTKGIGTEIYYPVPFHRQECFQYLNTHDADYPVANFLAAHSLALPIYPELSEEHIATVVAAVAEFYR